MKITWYKFDGGYGVRLYLDDTKTLIVPQEIWLVTIITDHDKGYGSVLVPIAID